jgi:hypothetical protein
MVSIVVLAWQGIAMYRLSGFADVYGIAKIKNVMLVLFVIEDEVTIE